VLTVKQLIERFPSKRSLKPADCLIVEDAPTVIREVKRIGFPVLAVATSYPVERLAEADYIVQSLRPEDVRKNVPELKAFMSPE